MTKRPTTDPALYASLFPRSVSKSEKRKFRILKGAIACYATLGVERTTYEAIATKSKSSRTLILHYFPERAELLKLVFQFIRADMQKSAIGTIELAKTPEEQLTGYIQSCFDWLHEKPLYWTVWMLLFYYSGVRRELKQMHSELTAMGHDRILVMISALASNKNEAAGGLALRAKTLQALITGALIAVHSETLSLQRDQFVQQTINDCFRIATG